MKNIVYTVAFVSILTSALSNSGTAYAQNWENELRRQQQQQREQQKQFEQLQEQRRWREQQFFQQQQWLEQQRQRQQLDEIQRRNDSSWDLLNNRW